MKKILIILLTLLLISGCTKNDSPEQLLTKAYENQEKLNSLTIEGTMTLISKSEEGSFEIPMTIITMVDNKENEDPTDDEAYVSSSFTLLGQEATSKAWSIGQDVYLDDGNNKTHTISQKTSQTVNVENIISSITKNAETIDLEKSGNDRILKIKLKQAAMADFAKDMMATTELDSAIDMYDLSNINISDIILTIDPNDYINRIELTIDTTIDNVTTSTIVDYNFKDRNSTVIPSFNPDEFTFVEESSYGDGSFEIIVFDNGDQIQINMDKPEEYMCYFSDDDQMLSIFNETDYLADALFVSKEFASQLYESVDSTDAYRLSYQADPVVTNGKAQMKVCFAEKDTDIFNANTPLAVVVFDDFDLGALYVGYGTEEEFKDLIDQISYSLN